ncbi:MAG TPA: hypothetical protein VHF28_06035 [Nitrososphaera sp.]|nr:hypothetical protein [Nitrososphaera sp.]
MSKAKIKESALNEAMREEEETNHQEEEQPDEAKENPHLIKLRDTGDDNEMVAVKTDEEEKAKEEGNT